MQKNRLRRYLLKDTSTDCTLSETDPAYPAGRAPPASSVLLVNVAPPDMFLT